MIFTKLRNRLQKRNANHRENGDDIVLMLFMLPIILGITFSVIDLSTYFQTKMRVLEIVEINAREAALQGGAGANSPLNTSMEDQSYKLRAGLYYSPTDPDNNQPNADGGQCVISYCESRPVTVVPLTDNPVLWNSAGTGYQQSKPEKTITTKVWAQCTPCVTTKIIEHVTCSAVYNYGGIASSITRVFGLGIISSIPITETVTLQTETELTGLSITQEYVGQTGTNGATCGTSISGPAAFTSEVTGK